MSITDTNEQYRVGGQPSEVRNNRRTVIKLDVTVNRYKCVFTVRWADLSTLSPVSHLLAIMTSPSAIIAQIKCLK